MPSAGEQFKTDIGLNINHVPHKGGGPALTDLMGGHVPVLFSSLGSAASSIRGGRVIPLAESSFPGFDATIWFGIVAPAGLPAKVMEKLVLAMTAALADPAVQESIRKEGYDTMTFTP